MAKSNKIHWCCIYYAYMFGKVLPRLPKSSIDCTVLPDYYSPSNMGLLDPATSDGRVIFFLPWQNHTIAGTTDSPCQVREKKVRY